MQAVPIAPDDVVQTDFLAKLGFRPLMKVDEVCYWLNDCSDDHVRRLIEAGDLRAIDISAAWPANERRELRVYRFSFELFLARERYPHGRAASANSFSIKPDVIIPHGLATLRADEVCRLINCCGQHLLNLTQAGHLAGPSYAPQGTAVDRTRRIWRNAFVGFLNAREIKD